MKRIIVFLLILLFPVIIFAKEFESSDINIKFSVNDDFMVLTRDNLENNQDLEKLLISKEDMLEIMTTNNIYFDVIKNDVSYEIIFVVPNNELDIETISGATDIALEDLKEKLAKEAGAEIASVYKNNYNYIVVEHHDESTDNWILNYYTIINSRGYNIQLQKKGELTTEDRNSLKEIVDTIEFKIKENNNGNNNLTPTNKYKKPFDYKIIIYGIILGCIAGLITYYIEITYKKKKSSK